MQRFSRQFATAWVLFFSQFFVAVTLDKHPHGQVEWQTRKMFGELLAYYVKANQMRMASLREYELGKWTPSFPRLGGYISPGQQLFPSLPNWKTGVRTNRTTSPLLFFSHTGFCTLQKNTFFSHTQHHTTTTREMWTITPFLRALALSDFLYIKSVCSSAREGGRHAKTKTDIIGRMVVHLPIIWIRLISLAI